METLTQHPSDLARLHQHEDQRWDPEPAGIKQAEPSQEQIAAAAYEIFERRGRQDGGDLDDWLEAEQRLKAAQPYNS